MSALKAVCPRVAMSMMNSAVGLLEGSQTAGLLRGSS